MNRNAAGVVDTWIARAEAAEMGPLTMRTLARLEALYERDFGSV